MQTVKKWIKAKHMKDLLIPEVGLTFENYPFLRSGCSARRYYELSVRLTGQRIAPEVIRSVLNGPADDFFSLAGGV